MKSIEKMLTSNDVGETGSHQSGITIPSDPAFVNFFPGLPEKLNPSLMMRFLDPEGRAWDFRYVYYNNRRHGGTRDERRLCRTTKFLRSFRARAGDILVLSDDAEGCYSASIRRSPREPEPIAPPKECSGGRNAQGTSHYRIICKNGSWTLLEDDGP